MSAPTTVLRAPRIAALVLAAGRSTRMQGENKLLAQLGGVPLVARVVDEVLAAGIAQVLVVTGHDAAGVRAALAGRAVAFAHNAEFEQGLASSLHAGLAAIAAHHEGALVCLGDMPRVRAAHIQSLIDAFAASRGQDVCVPFHAGRRGNPVLWPARCFAALQRLRGDTGGRVLLEAEAEHVRRVTAPDDGVLVDADTPAALAALARAYE